MDTGNVNRMNRFDRDYGRNNWVGDFMDELPKGSIF